MESEVRLWTTEIVSEIIESAKAAILRSRFVFISINVATVILLTSQFNGYFPWIRNISLLVHQEMGQVIEKITLEKLRTDPNFRPDEHKLDTVDKLTNDPIYRSDRIAALGVLKDDPEYKYQEHRFDTIDDSLWRDIKTVQMPLVGLRMSMYDLSIIGGMSMCVLAIWFFFVVRREHHVVKKLMDCAKDLWESDKNESRRIYHGIGHYFVFMPIVKENDPDPVDRVMTASVKMLMYSPFWSLLIVAGMDLVSIFTPTVNSLGNTTSLWDEFTTCGKAADNEIIRSCLSAQFEMIIRIVICLLFSLFCFVQCYRCDKYDKETTERVRDLRFDVEEYEESNRGPGR